MANDIWLRGKGRTGKVKADTLPLCLEPQASTISWLVRTQFAIRLQHVLSPFLHRMAWWSEHGIVRSSRCHSQPVLSYSFAFVICKKKARSNLEGKIEEVLLLTCACDVAMNDRWCRPTPCPNVIDRMTMTSFQARRVMYGCMGMLMMWYILCDLEASKLSALPLLAHFSRYSLPTPPHHQLTN
jgi:hypothetical protein